VVTEVTGRDMVCGAGYVACRDLPYIGGLRGVVTEFVCPYCFIYIQDTIVKGTAIYRGVWGTGNDQFHN
jgi:hypothetical protein